MLELLSKVMSNEPSDPYWNNVTLLMHMETPSLNDEKGNVVYLSGSPFSIEQSRFGSGSAKVTGTDIINLGRGHNIAPEGIENFTIEGFIYPTGNVAYGSIFGGGYPIQFYLASGFLDVYFASQNAFPYFIQGKHPSAVILNEWSHVALVRNGLEFSIYLRGIKHTLGTSSGTIAKSTSELQIGSNLNDYRFLGYIDEMRITRGVARYTQNFIPPSRPFTNY